MTQLLTLTHSVIHEGNSILHSQFNSELTINHFFLPRYARLHLNWAWLCSGVQLGVQTQGRGCCWAPAQGSVPCQAALSAQQLVPAILHGLVCQTSWSCCSKSQLSWVCSCSSQCELASSLSNGEPFLGRGLTPTCWAAHPGHSAMLVSSEMGPEVILQGSTVIHPIQAVCTRAGRGQRWGLPLFFSQTLTNDKLCLE